MSLISLSAALYNWYRYNSSSPTFYDHQSKNARLRLEKGNKIAIRKMPDGTALLYEEGEESFKFKLSEKELKTLMTKVDSFGGAHQEGDAPIRGAKDTKANPTSEPPVIHLTATEARRLRKDATQYQWYKYTNRRGRTVKDFHKNEVGKLHMNDLFGLLTADPTKGGYFMNYEDAVPHVITSEVLSSLDLGCSKIRLPKKFAPSSSEESETFTTGVRGASPDPQQSEKQSEKTITPPKTSPPATKETTDYIITMKQTVADIVKSMKELHKNSVTSMSDYSDYADKLREIRDVRIKSLYEEMKANGVPKAIGNTISDLLKEYYDAACDVLRQKKRHLNTLNQTPDDSNTNEPSNPVVRISRENAAKFADLAGVNVGSILHLPEEYKDRLNALLKRSLDDRAAKRQAKAILDEAKRLGHIPSEQAEQPTKTVETPIEPTTTNEDAPETFTVGTGGKALDKKAAIKEIKRIAEEGSDVIDAKIRDFPIATNLEELDEVNESVKSAYDTYYGEAESILNTSKASKRDFRDALAKLLNMQKKANDLYANTKKVLEQIGHPPAIVVTDGDHSFTPLVDDDGEPVSAPTAVPTATIDKYEDIFENRKSIFADMGISKQSFLAFDKSTKDSLTELTAAFIAGQVSKSDLKLLATLQLRYEISYREAMGIAGGYQRDVSVLSQFSEDSLEYLRELLDASKSPNDIGVGLRNGTIKLPGSTAEVTPVPEPIPEPKPVPAPKPTPIKQAPIPEPEPKPIPKAATTVNSPLNPSQRKSLIGLIGEEGVKKFTSLEKDFQELVIETLTDLSNGTIKKSDAISVLEDIYEDLIKPELVEEVEEPIVITEPDPTPAEGDDRETEASVSDYRSLLGDDNFEIQKNLEPKKVASTKPVVAQPSAYLDSDDLALLNQISSTPAEVITTMSDEMQEIVKESLNDYRNGKLTKKQLTEIIEEDVLLDRGSLDNSSEPTPKSGSPIYDEDDGDEESSINDVRNELGIDFEGDL